MKYVVIGAGAAAINGASWIRRLDPQGDIAMISREQNVHSRCMLHKILEGSRSIESIDFAGSDFFITNNVRWVPGKTVVQVDPKTKKVMFSDGDYEEFDRLLIATGAVTQYPKVENLAECKDTYGLRNLEDAVAILEKLERESARRVVVLGAGLVGMEAVHALLHKDLDIHVVEMSSRIMPLHLDNYAACFYQSKFEQQGVSFHLGQKITRVELDPDGRLQAVHLENGQCIPSDIILVASGIKPNVKIAARFGIEAMNGILVNKYMQTSQKDIYAAGDVTGLSGTWDAAVKQAIVAAHNMVKPGSREHPDDYNLKNTLDFFDVPTLSVGCTEPLDSNCQVFVRNCHGNYQKLILMDNMIIGALFVGDISNKGHWQYLIKNCIPLPEVQGSPLDITFANFFAYNETTGKYSYSASGMLD